jgi:hypothetical protein
MPTSTQVLIGRARKHLREPVAKFWTDAELLVHAIDGYNDLWKMVLDLYEEHYFTFDETNVTLPANSSTLSGIQPNMFRIKSIEARDLTPNSTNRGLEFIPRKWNHYQFEAARRINPVEPNSNTICYLVAGEGPPVSALTVRVAPQVSSVVNLTVAYLKAHSATALESNNPIPGFSDKAIEYWIVAHARAKEREDGSPDPEALAIYANEKMILRVAMEPRQEQELEQVEGLFEGVYW